MRPRIEPKPAGTTAFKVKWINILKMFPLIYRYGCADVEGGILEASTIFQSSNVPAEHAGSTAVQTAHKDVLAVPFMFLWHNFADSGFAERLPLAGLSGPGNDKLR